MSKSAKIWLITAVLLIVLGSSIFVIAMFKIDWDFTKLSTAKFETNTYDLTDDFNSISLFFLFKIISPFTLIIII